MNKSNIVMFRSFIIKDLIAMKYLSIQAFSHFIIISIFFS